MPPPPLALFGFFGMRAVVVVLCSRSRHSLFKGVPVVKDDDQDSTDLMKCLCSLQEKEKADGVDVRRTRSIAHTHEVPQRTGGGFMALSLFSFFFLFDGIIVLCFRLLTTSSYSAACPGGSTRPSTHCLFCTSSAKADAGFSP